ncbi:MAG: PD40 domain-containing protein [Phycisphaerales bacterium]|nr:PD40 domain-containing protein [Phycisphaerales bacterium]
MRSKGACRLDAAACCAVLASILGLCADAPATGPVGYYRQPDVHGDTIAFVAEGDVWTVSVDGGVAQRLTSHPGDEQFPAISPDGTRLAFVASYEGPRELYVMPLAGGLPERLTFDGGAIEVAGWTPDGRVVYSTRSRSTLPNVQLVIVDPSDPANPPDAVHPTVEPIPLAQAAEGTYAGDANDPMRSLVFTRQAFQGSHAKRYQGGTAQNLWRFDRGATEAVPLTADWTGASRWPMWGRGRVWFASDRDGTMNIWSMAIDGTDLRQHTHHVGWDVLGPAMDGDRIVYQLGADLHVLDVRDDSDRIVPITLASDLDQTREQWIAKPMDYLTSAQVAPDGKRVALTVRGEVFVFPAKQGRRVHVDPDSGTRYREARFMPDGKSLLALSDRSGEIEFWTLPADGLGEPVQRTTGATVLRWTGLPSPDGKWIASTDKNHRLFLHEVETGETRTVAQSPIGDFGDIAWAPDSRWFAVVGQAPNLFRQVSLCRVDDGSLTPVTTDRYDSGSPFFSPDGKWLYLVSERHLDTSVDSPWGPYQPEPYMARTSQLFQIPLRKGERSPFAPEDELHPEKGDKDKGKETNKDKEPGSGTPDKAAAPPTPGDAAAPEQAPATTSTETAAAKPETVPPIEIDLDGIASRIQQVPVPPGAYGGLAVNDGALFWLARDPGENTRRLLAVEIGRDEHKVVTVAEKVSAFELSGDGKTLLVRRKDDLNLIPAKAAAADLAKTGIDLSGWLVSAAPRMQWRQMFLDAWRLHRDYFYDPDMHGVDWAAMRDKYLPLVDRVTTRAELSDLLAQMVAELSALHTFVYGGDLRQGPDKVQVAGLGALLERDADAGGWRVGRIFRSDPDEPESAGPLARPGSEVAEGELIERIDGVSTLSVADPSILLRNKAGRQVRLEVRSAGPEEASRAVIVEPIGMREEANLRYGDWELSRREAVERLGEGRLGYVHLRAMGDSDWTAWAKNYYPVFTREGLIIDVRHNRGGNIDSWILSRLLRKAWFTWSDRVGAPPEWNMQYAFRGHVVVLCDEWTASDGEAFTEGIKRLGIGTVIGTRTWGGEIWLSSSNNLVDRGIATAAETGVYGPEGAWLIEGHGVEPDIVVDNLPHETYNGRDRQLERAIEVLQEQIRREPVVVPARPAFPVKK